MKKLKAFLFIGILLTCTTCLTKPEFDQIPSIEFLGITKVFIPGDTTGGVGVGGSIGGSGSDFITISVRLRDGDGNVGLNPSDTAEPFQPFIMIDGENIVNEKRNNYIVNLYRKVDGEFVLFEFDSEGFVIEGTIPRLKDDDENGPVEADLDYSFVIRSSTYEFRNDTVRFDVKVLDRDLNESNTIVTDTLVINTN